LLHIYKHDINILFVVLTKAFEIIVGKKDRLVCIAAVNIELSSLIYTYSHLLIDSRQLRKQFPAYFAGLKQKEESFTSLFSTPNLTYACVRNFRDLCDTLCLKFNLSRASASFA